MLGYLLVWSVLAVVGSLIALAVNGRILAGAVLGALLGPIGWLIVLFLQDIRAKCPKCRGIVPLDAELCRHCGASLTSSSAPRWENGEPFCMQCGEDGVTFTEMGQLVAECPKCGQRL